MKRAVVLSGGAALGAYELGAWRYLREINYHYDIVTGTSIGAIMGGFMCVGDYEGCEDLWLNTGAEDVYVNGVNFDDAFFENMDRKKVKNLVDIGREYFSNEGLNITPFKQLIHSKLNAKAIHESPVQLGIVTCVYPGMREEDFILQYVDEELVLPYIHCSSAAWPVLSLEKIGNKKYADGGYRNNVPVDLAIKMGADEIVAIRFDPFPKLPQHGELLRLPFVINIVPFSPLDGGVGSLDPTCIRRNIERGYCDAGKAFGKFVGYNYTFHKDPGLESKCRPIMARVVRNYPRKLTDLTKLVGIHHNPFVATTSTALVLRSFELLAEILKIDNVPIYHLNEWGALIARKIIALGDSLLNQKRAFETKWGGRVKPDEIEPFFLYLYDCYQRKEMPRNLNQIINNNPIAILLLEALNLFEKRGYLKTAPRLGSR